MFHFSKKPSKKQVLIVSGAVVLIAAVIGWVAFAERHERFEKNSEKFSRSEIRWNDRGFSKFEKKSDIARAVSNTASGADIVLTPSNSGALSVLGGEFAVLKGSSSFQNSAFKADASEASGSLRISVTSNIPEVIKLIQAKAASQESGTFGTDLLGQARETSSEEEENDGYESFRSQKNSFKEGERHGPSQRSFR